MALPEASCPFGPLPPAWRIPQLSRLRPGWRLSRAIPVRSCLHEWTVSGGSRWGENLWACYQAYPKGVMPPKPASDLATLAFRARESPLYYRRSACWTSRSGAPVGASKLYFCATPQPLPVKTLQFNQGSPDHGAAAAGMRLGQGI